MTNDFISYLTHFELIADVHSWNCSLNGIKFVEWPHYFALIMQKSAIAFQRIFQRLLQIANMRQLTLFGGDTVETLGVPRMASALRAAGRGNFNTFSKV